MFDTVRIFLSMPARLSQLQNRISELKALLEQSKQSQEVCCDDQRQALSEAVSQISAQHEAIKQELIADNARRHAALNVDLRESLDNVSARQTAVLSDLSKTLMADIADGLATELDQMSKDAQARNENLITAIVGLSAEVAGLHTPSTIQEPSDYSIRVQLLGFPSDICPTVEIVGPDLRDSASVDKYGYVEFSHLQPSVEYLVTPQSIAEKVWEPTRASITLRPTRPTKQLFARMRTASDASDALKPVRTMEASEASWAD